MLLFWRQFSEFLDKNLNDTCGTIFLSISVSVPVMDLGVKLEWKAKDTYALRLWMFYNTD